MRVEFDGIGMSFGRIEVLHGVSFSVTGGRIMALLGENGAGKSTLMNILGGLLRPCAGRVLIDGVAVDFKSPNDSIRHGIAFIHQELNPVNDLMVYENIFLGRELTGRGGFLRRDEMRREARRILDSLDIQVDEQAYMRQLDASYKQIVEICRALLGNARVIIMDEPTTSLAAHEISRLFQLVRKLRASGVAIIFISHKLNEVCELCTDYAVLRNGSLVASGVMDDTVTPELLSLHIVGRELSAMQRPKAGNPGAEVLRVEKLSRAGEFSEVSFSVRSGEILGITGLLGDGRSEVCRTIFGDTDGYQGRIFLDGKPFKAASIRQAMAHGIAYVPANRKENAIIPDMSVLFNGTLASLQRCRRLGLIDTSVQQRNFDDASSDFHVKYGDVRDLITTLSGGNQQKVILARWLNTFPRLLILDNPTQGVDIGAKQEIYGIIRKVAESGVAVIVLSGEGQEIIRLCSRACVMFHGRIAGELYGAELTEQKIMQLATGARAAEQEGQVF